MAEASTQDAAQVAPRGELREGPKREQRELGPEEAVQAAARKQSLDDKNQGAALEWFLSSEADDPTKAIQVDVGVGEERWIDWTIRPIDLDALRRIRRLATVGPRGRQEVDDAQANLRIVVDGTVDPDLKAIAARLGIADPALALRQRFAAKPGLLGLIAGEILALSGYDDEKVREAEAAGNS